MADSFEMDELRASLRRIMERKDVRPTALSLQVSRSKTLVKDLLEKNADVQLSTVVKLAGALDVDVETLLGRARVPIAGHIGAGGQIVFEDIGELYDPDSTVLRPPGISGQLIALEVRGDSMFPKYRDGDVIYVQRNHEGLLPEYLGEDCVVRLETGETYIKQLAHGSEPGRFTLRSLNAPDMVDVDIEWATPVIFIMPVRARSLGA